MNTTSKQPMTIQEFRTRYHLKLTKDKCGEEIIPGKLGHLFDHGDGQFGMVLEDAPSGDSRARALLSRKRAALRGGFSLKQQGECESILLFDARNPKQAELAAKLVMAKKKRNVQANPASLANLVRPSTQMPPQLPGTDKLAGVEPGEAYALISPWKFPMRALESRASRGRSQPSNREKGRSRLGKGCTLSLPRESSLRTELGSKL